MEYTNLRYEQNGRVVRLIKQNAEQGYCMTAELTREMFDALKKARADDSVGVIVIDSDGVHQGAFAVSEAMFTGVSYLQLRETVALGHELCRLIERIEKPVIGVVRKEANGGGFETLDPCDFVICADTAVLTQPEVNLGGIAGWGGVQRLGRMIGWRKAQELLLLGEPVDGKTAEALGIVTKSVPEDKVDEAVDQLCQRLLNVPIQSFSVNKRDLLHVHTMTMYDALEAEIDYTSGLITEGLFSKAVEALMQNKAPEYPPYHRYLSGKDINE